MAIVAAATSVVTDGTPGALGVTGVVVAGAVVAATAAFGINVAKHR
ncbi:hypothetical protein DB30_04220 [Enhygromyxa salina]|uniref:Uncharacterized protein n=1 Tax=Enhygromyxa salina TaxID=215803 RepID=A0A0C2DA29_9BACT|nr:hypothetical protein DB30_04220 [Enhygromyxa salina]